MASHRTSTGNTARGFSLVEILIVIGLLAVIGGFTIVVNLNDYRASAFREERSRLIIALQKARSASLNNLNLAPHGVSIYPADNPESFVIFQGDTYASRDTSQDEILRSEYAITFAAGSPREVLFSQLAAEAECDGAPCTDSDPIVMEDQNRGLTFDIVLNEEGRISW